jgi:hypothetical protein
MVDINLREAVRQCVLKNLPYDRSNSALCAELQAKDAPELLIAYYNWMSRLIPPLPRVVKKSKAFDANPLVSQRATDFATIIDDVRNGRDLTRYLSRGIKNAADVSAKPLKRRRDLDLMLNDWNIHHLHISTTLESDGFVTRDGPLLFGVFTHETAYLIDVMQHGDWTREHVMRVVADEWPNEGIIHELKGIMGGSVIGLSSNPTEKERQKLREVGVVTPFELNGRVFVPGGILSTAGTSFRASQAATNLLRTLGRFEKEVRQHPHHIKQAFAQHGIKYPEQPKFEFHFLHPRGYGVFETVTKTLIPLG